MRNRINALNLKFHLGIYPMRQYLYFIILIYLPGSVFTQTWHHHTNSFYKADTLIPGWKIPENRQAQFNESIENAPIYLSEEFIVFQIREDSAYLISILDTSISPLIIVGLPDTLRNPIFLGAHILSGTDNLMLFHTKQGLIITDFNFKYKARFPLPTDLISLPGGFKPYRYANEGFYTQDYIMNEFYYFSIVENPGYRNNPKWETLHHLYPPDAFYLKIPVKCLTPAYQDSTPKVKAISWTTNILPSRYSEIMSKSTHLDYTVGDIYHVDGLNQRSIRINPETGVMRFFPFASPFLNTMPSLYLRRKNFDPLKPIPILDKNRKDTIAVAEFIQLGMHKHQNYSEMRSRYFSLTITNDKFLSQLCSRIKIDPILSENPEDRTFWVYQHNVCFDKPEMYILWEKLIRYKDRILPYKFSRKGISGFKWIEQEGQYIPALINWKLISE